jgi:hypothetical protein
MFTLLLVLSVTCLLCALTKPFCWSTQKGSYLFLDVLMETIHAKFLSRGTLSVSDNYLAYTDRYVLRALRHIGEWRFGPDSPLPLISLNVTILGCVPWHMSSRHGASAG